MSDYTVEELAAAIQFEVEARHAREEEARRLGAALIVDEGDGLALLEILNKVRAMKRPAPRKSAQLRTEDAYGVKFRPAVNALSKEKRYFELPAGCNLVKNGICSVIIEYPDGKRTIILSFERGLWRLTHTYGFVPSKTRGQHRIVYRPVR